MSKLDDNPKARFRDLTQSAKELLLDMQVGKESFFSCISYLYFRVDDLIEALKRIMLDFFCSLNQSDKNYL